MNSRRPKKPRDTRKATVIPGSGSELTGGDLAYFAGVPFGFVREAVRLRKITPFRVLFETGYFFHHAEREQLLATLRALPGYYGNTLIEAARRKRREEIAATRRKPRPEPPRVVCRVVHLSQIKAPWL